MLIDELVNKLNEIKKVYGNIDVIMEVADVLEPNEDARTSLVGSIDYFHIGTIFDGEHFVCINNMEE